MLRLLNEERRLKSLVKVCKTSLASIKETIELLEKTRHVELEAQINKLCVMYSRIEHVVEISENKLKRMCVSSE